MKYHIAFKFLAILLCACFLLTALCAGVAIFAVAEAGLYSNTVEQLQLQSMENNLRSVANTLARRYAMTALSNCPEDFIEAYAYDYYPYQMTEDESLWFYTVEDENGRILESRYDAAAAAGASKMEYLVNITYPVVLDYTVIDTATGLEIGSMKAASQETVPDTTQVTVPQEETVDTTPVTVPQEEATQAPATPGTVAPVPADAEYDYIENWGYEDENGIHYDYRLGICVSPVYLVTLYLLPGAYEQEAHWSWNLAQLGHTHRYDLIWILGVSLLLFAVTLVYLCCAAGRKPRSEEVYPGGLNRIPLDLYAVGAGMAVIVLAAGCADLINWHLDYIDPVWLIALAVGAMAFAACLLIVAFLFACAAQFKMRDAWWLRHSLIGMALMGCIKLLSWVFRWLEKACKWLGARLPRSAKKLAAAGKKLYEALKKIVLTLWSLLKKAVTAILALLGRGLQGVWNWIQRFTELLPLTWQWLFTAFGMILLLYIAFNSYTGFWLVVCVLLYLGIVLYGAHCFGTLLESTKRMSKGDLDTQVDDKLLLGSFREYASHLNALAGVAVEAARKQMKSERMKAELVTNVSHDIKTPLTSIINYVDLLQKAESQEQAEEYLEVLSRQSQRLKKLIEDLMEMSKASTGNMTVELTAVDAVEAVNQALGEFSDKLAQAQLTPVFNPPQEPVTMTADGRLAWRVLSNLLSNAVKYALPGTRLYIDLVQLDGKVLISLKNISREQLNVSSEELMERFVRGDESRNTEGSGLGLNIARSLMDLQKGQLQLLVDGDLFKATLIFPEA